MKRLSDFLDIFDGYGLWCTIWFLDEDDEPIYKGSFKDIPYWIATLKLPTKEEAYKEDYDGVISYRSSGDGIYKDKPGLVILVKE